MKPGFSFLLGMIVGAVMTRGAAQASETPPLQYDHPFHGRLIVEVLPYWEARERCRYAWDIPRGGWANACSWHFDDPQNPGMIACHVVYPKLERGVWWVDEMVAAIREETANCNGLHDNEGPIHV